MPAPNALQLAVGIVSSFVQRNKVVAADLPGLITTVHRAIIDTGDEPAASSDERKATPAQIRRSITADGLVSFEDGKPYRILKRHRNTYGLTPEEYRAKWGLPSDYPMTAPAYAQKRSEIAKAAGLGRLTRGSRKLRAPVDRQP
jgi:predicted transcriptional regulator